MSTPEKPENEDDTTSNDEAEVANEKSDGSEPDRNEEAQPETVEAEIVDPDEAGKSEDPDHLESETIDSDNGTPAEEKSQSFATTGVILLGVMALGLIVFFLNQGTDEGHEVAEAEAVDLLAATENTADEADSPTIARDEESPTREQPAEVAEMQSSEPVATPEVLTEQPVEEATIAEQTAEERRLAAIERNRARREARESAANPDADTSQQSEEVAENTVASAVEIAEVAPEDAASVVEEQAMVEAVPQVSQPADEIDGDADVPGNTIIVSDAKIANEIARLKEDLIATTQAAIAEDKQRLVEQENEIDRLRREMDEALAEQERRAQQLEARLDTLQTRDVATATKQAALSIAVTNLQRQISSGRPFAEQLTVLEQLSPETVGIRALEPYADTGLPTISGLRQKYANAARKALAAANRNEAEGFWGEFGARFTGLFSVRKTGLVEGDNPSAIISRAEVHMEEGDLAACLRELDTLDGEAAEAMNPWMEEARSLVLADQLLDSVSSRVLTAL